MTAVGTFLETFWIGMALHLWQTSLVLALLLVLALGVRKAPARYFAAIGWIALLKLALPVSLLSALFWPVLAMFGESASALATAGLTEYVRVVLEPEALASASVRSIDFSLVFYIVLSVAWLLGMPVLLWTWGSRVGGAFEETLKLAAAPTAITNRIRDALLGTTISPQTVRLVRSPTTPVVRGILRPTIVLSLPVAESLTVDELRAVLLHEHGHRRRWDTLRAAAQRAVLTVFFFYPPVWWIVARSRASVEIACDESVLSRGVPPALYSRALARVAATGLGLMPAIGPEEVGLERPGSLLSRFDRIENAWRYRAMTKHRVLAAVAVLVVIASLVVPALPAAAMKPHSEDAAEPEDRFKALDRLELDPDPIVVHFDRTSLSDVFKGLAKETGVRFETLGSLSREVSITYSQINAREILVRLAETYNLSYEVLDPRALRVRGGPLLPWGPQMPDNEKVTKPVLIPSSKVDPVYPAGPRNDGIEANVILQVVIHHDGSVSEVQVLRTNEPDMGFEEAAIEAVRQWHYEPALYEGVPVAVYFTVFVEFKLDSNSMT